MSVTDIAKDLDALTLTVTAEFAAPPDRVWELWADPRKLEKWWGPPSYPATFVQYDLRPGGEVGYFMTGPEGDKHYGWWQVAAVDPPHALSFTDGFGDDEGRPDPEMPTTETALRLYDRDGGTRMELVARFSTREEMEQLDEMGMTEGLREAIGQMDGLLD
jgi:uncharacterized protein YndB with AHSA1/START domain